MTQTCIKCRRLGHLSTCHGCQQSFCDEHVTKHREELSHQMDNINRKYRDFEGDLNGNKLIQAHLTRIDQWENESITKIQKTAEIARNDLLEIFDRMKNQMKSSLEKINSDIQTNREFETYTEINLNQWTEQLQQLRQVYKTSLTNEIIDENQSSIRLIKIINRKPEELNSFPREKFDHIIGLITLSKDRLIATCSGKKWNGSNISGTNLYSSGLHSIRFQITKKGKINPFFGITSAIKESNPWNRKTPFAYGWWEIPLQTDEEETLENLVIKTGDQVTLTLDCTNNQIQFEHHRTNRYIDELITNEQCPFPWKIAIVLYSPGDSVRILS